MKILSVSTGRSEVRMIEGRAVPTAIGKTARTGPVVVTPLGLAGDEQADQSVHGGQSKAIYAYPVAHYPFWQGVRAQASVAPAEPVIVSAPAPASIVSAPAPPVKLSAPF